MHSWSLSRDFESYSSEHVSTASPHDSSRRVHEMVSSSLST